MKVILNYLGQQSTWKGLIGVATAAGIALSPDQAAAITATVPPTARQVAATATALRTKS